MSFISPNTQCADKGSFGSCKSEKLKTGNKEELSFKPAKFTRFLHFGMLRNGNDCESVRLTGVNPKLTQEEGKSQLYHESKANSDNQILGPTGTVRGVKNIVRSRKEFLKGSSDCMDIKEVS